ncbi:hypothetical protein F5050DRAFT_1803705 [Lentinula boryana]|uniref:Uncharacterized protein n=1 Tax=Lentinula boryana TaxID=40481 RepID=A0ABQ8QQY8_9AGAR|nr:hypothetical protein F5050DRAFT_1803705 [Lentinula boryana]
MPRLSSTLAVAIIALTAVSTVDALSLSTSNERVYSRHFSRHFPVPRHTNKHDVAVSGLETVGKVAVAGAEMQGASVSEPQRRSDVGNGIRATGASAEFHEGYVIPAPPEATVTIKNAQLDSRSFGKEAAKFLDHAGKAAEGADAVGTVAETVSGRSLLDSRDLDHHDSISLGKRRRSKKKKGNEPAEHKEEQKEEPKSTEEPKSNENSGSGTNKHDVAVAGFQAAGDAAAAFAGMQGSGSSTPE